MERNSYLVKKAIRSFILASVLTAALQQFIQVTHSVILGQFVGPDAVSAISLVAPLMLIPLMLNLLFSTGAMVLASRVAGERNYEKLVDIFSVSMLTVMACGLLYSMVGVLFRGQLSQLICNNARLLPLVSEYLPVAIGLSFVTVMFQSLAGFTEVDGSPAMVTYAMIGSLLLVVVLDLLFIRVFNLGIVSAALSTASAHLLAAIWLALAFRRRKSTYKLNFRPRNFGMILKENIQSGIPLSLSILIMVICTLLMNGMVLKALGADGVFAISIAGLLISLFNLFVTGTYNTFRAIGGLFYGQRDFLGLRILLRQLLRIVMVAAVLCTLFCELLAPQIVNLYGCDTPELVALTAHRLRIVFTMFIIFLPLLFMPAVYQVLGYNFLVVVSTLISNILNVIGIALFCHTGHAELLWWSFPLSSWIGGLVVVLLAWQKHRELPDTSPLTLLPIDRNKDCRLDFSVACGQQSFEQAQNEVHAFLEKASLSSDTANRIETCAEELLKNIVAYAGIGEKHFVDITINLGADETALMVKNDGKPFNPMFFSKEEENTISNLYEEMDYKYMYGQNMTFLIFKNIKS